ncbi:hypothetical protein [Nocardioides solisilvae]|uniref:hypothetical protein n=1 Tax=Nocardioides solisilvae TaxID=1542435 RepID=UPI000D7426FA|nr:hypothetical protein [Nocardioides solisilvae]
MTTPLPEAAALAWWGTAWLRGEAVTDLVLDALAADGTLHAVAPGDGRDGQGTHDGAGTLLDLLVQLRRRGATSLGLALPADGDPLGLGGPPSFNLAALEAGQAVVAADAGLGAVPQVVGESVTWQLFPAARRSVPDVGEADRELRGTVLAVADDLAELDVARWRPELADAVMELRRLPALDPPPGVPERCVSLAARAVQALAVVELAGEDHGSPVSASEMARREGALAPLDRAARRALVAACSPEVWPDPPRERPTAG